MAKQKLIMIAFSNEGIDALIQRVLVENEVVKGGEIVFGVPKDKKNKHRFNVGDNLV
ncbi:MAG: hypothetical protein F6J89_07045 [Symploca sp. SIO1C4]|uniref:Uncharacterized protein n=1 Tax=Symploca sp. SIO1C4 TaxID=2607765 RepID=A0A6B3NBH2_9CYAN|nr:hypothetical protein [Symploca sp. SIO1C4]